MVLCERCNTWQHVACSDYSTAELKQLKRYLCWKCCVSTSEPELPPSLARRSTGGSSNRRFTRLDVSSPSRSPLASVKKNLPGRPRRNHLLISPLSKQQSVNKSPPDSVDEMKNVLKRYMMYMHAHDLVTVYLVDSANANVNRPASSSSSSLPWDRNKLAKNELGKEVSDKADSVESSSLILDVVSMDDNNSTSPVNTRPLPSPPCESHTSHQISMDNNNIRSPVMMCAQAFMESIHAFEERFGKV